MNINSTLVHGFYDGSDNGKGHDFTLTWLLGYLLRKAEDRFGTRDRNFTILGLTFSKDGPPQIWFPGSGPDHISVILSSVAQKDMNAAKSELSHEVAHLLAPSRNANVLEEGCCEWFSHAMQQDAGFTAANDPKYIAVSDLVQKLLDIDKEIIKRIRYANNGRFDTVAPRIIQTAEQRVSDSLAEEVCHKFSSWSPTPPLSQGP